MIKKSNIISGVVGLLIILISLILLFLEVKSFDIKAFYFTSGIAVIIIILPFFLNFIAEAGNEKEKETMFLEFSRDLSEGVKAGTPINKSLINVRNKDYGSLSPHIQKLANQVSLGIPIKEAFETFSNDVGNSVIRRAITLIREAEVSGGRIDLILDSVTNSVAQIQKLRKERKASVYNLTIQGYIIFFVFILIMLVMQFKILPIVSEINPASEMSAGDAAEFGTSLGSISMNPVSFKKDDFSKPFLFLLLTQGLFAGLVIGKVSEGSVKAGLKHSFVLMAVAWIASTGANLFLA